ncbi:hypothetical protein [Lacimicrobium alkaliphilum]|uniref:NERD domain-containing protein n=1 Tax=Lacimicrobium alkaliphilum TaxID=1526571 RepID=A0ABQ1RPH7_9ALTE|nr:hypothetical protein [Lacimicrobium alkaliphilum]GGD73475.1 hypothetical protein GCM10011357_30710 [Lacimicrobium alkaliphilum]
MHITAKQIMGWTQSLILNSQHGTTNKFISACLTKGGAEGWVQVELDAVYKTLPGNPAVQREQAIYTDRNLSVDFLITNADGVMCIELKVESLFQSSGDGHVTIPHGGWKKVQDDVRKLSEDRNATYAAADACVVALAWSEELTSAISQWLSHSGLEYEQEIIDVVNDSAYRVSVFVIKVG